MKIRDLVFVVMLVLPMISCKKRDFQDNKSDTAAISATKGGFLSLFGLTTRTYLWAVPDESDTAQCWYKYEVEDTFASDYDDKLFLKSTPIRNNFIKNEAVGRQLQSFNKNDNFWNFVEYGAYMKTMSVIGAVGCGVGSMAISLSVTKYPSGEAAMLAVFPSLLFSGICGVGGAAFGAGIKYSNNKSQKEALEQAKEETYRLAKEDPNYFRKVDYKVVQNLIKAVEDGWAEGSTGKPCPVPSNSLWQRGMNDLQSRVNSIKN